MQTGESGAVAARETRAFNLIGFVSIQSRLLRDFQSNKSYGVHWSFPTKIVGQAYSGAALMSGNRACGVTTCSLYLYAKTKKTPCSLFLKQKNNKHCKAL